MDAIQNQEKTDSLLSFYRVGDVNFLLTAGPDMINEHLREGKIWEPATLQISQLLIEGIEKPVIVDIGANIGAYAVPMGKSILAQKGKLFAFEPQRQVFYQLCANLLNNNLSNCFAYQMAIGDVDGEIEVPVLDILTEKNLGALSLDANIRMQQNILSSTIEEYEQVKISTLDSLSLPKANLVKVDVEGLELEVFKGARKWLVESGHPAILFEVWGDYMKDMIAKRNRLMNLMTRNLGYEVILFGELCIAQHPSNKRLEIERTAEGLELRRL
ncbi:FkbM family methyltransferase [Serratia sp. DD3]|uniref:FkbM family methyltransferase n=1 Tax=Serratia sp. DD3 TaxID=1410619 RepID=UPI0003C4F54D|nr:FkbM family methyltransferase [Serratia sp. DD3]KEY57849.1 methyltransferase, FkbM family [Serratia sp. DD3]